MSKTDPSVAFESGPTSLIGRPARLQEPKHCRKCNAVGATKACGRCKTSYCSAACQRDDWPYHKRCCKAAKKIHALAQSRDEDEFKEGVVAALSLPADALIFTTPRARDPENCAICLEAMDYRGGHVYMNCCSQFIHLACSQRQIKHALAGNPFGGDQSCPMCRGPSAPPGARGDRLILDRLRGHIAKGDHAAQYQMGCDVAKGALGLRPDKAESIRLLEASAEGEGMASLMAASRLAGAYIYDRELNPESRELGLRGLFFAHRLAREGDVYGLSFIGDCALHGYFIEPDQAKALNFLGCAAFLGNSKAQQLLSHFAWDAAELRAPRTEPAWPFSA